MTAVVFQLEKRRLRGKHSVPPRSTAERMLAYLSQGIEGIDLPTAQEAQDAAMLAAARHNAADSDLPSWKDVDDDKRVAAAIEALRWLRAARLLGLMQ